MQKMITAVDAMEILDSRGNPTVRVFITVNHKSVATASVPSGASTGLFEALELRDNDPKRYHGKGVLLAVENIKKSIAPALIGLDPRKQKEIDKILCELDGSENKQRLGANALLGVSIAVAKAGAKSCSLPLYRYLGGSHACRIPVPSMNIINGGEHAQNSIDLQEFMVVPVGFDAFQQGIRAVAETFHTLQKILGQRKLATSVGDEGGFAPNLRSNEQACEIILEAIEQAGYQPGTDIALAIDSAASSFSPNLKDEYLLSGSESKSSNEIISMAKKWCTKYPIISWEDPLAEKDWKGFKKFTAELGKKIQVVGDDIFVTNKKYIKKGITNNTANAALIKPNQIGTLSETIEAIELCRNAGWRYQISHRSGETEDTFLADFAVAMGGGQIKSGSASRSERIAKYNRLLEIERELSSSASYYW